MVSLCMVKRQQMCWSRDGAQHVLDVRTKVLNGTLSNRRSVSMSSLNYRIAKSGSRPSERSPDALGDLLRDGCSSVCDGDRSVLERALRHVHRDCGGML
jgi:hypothetical protein